MNAMTQENIQSTTNVAMLDYQKFADGARVSENVYIIALEQMFTCYVLSR